MIFIHRLVIIVYYAISAAQEHILYTYNERYIHYKNEKNAKKGTRLVQLKYGITKTAPNGSFYVSE